MIATRAAPARPAAKPAPAPIPDDGERAAQLAEVLKAVAHPLRLRLVGALCEGDQFVNALAERLGVPQSIASQQLGVLRMNRLVECERRDGKAWYRIAEPRLHDLLHCISGCRLH